LGPNNATNSELLLDIQTQLFLIEYSPKRGIPKGSTNEKITNSWNHADRRALKHHRERGFSCLVQAL
jgi:hypothetical protein